MAIGAVAWGNPSLEVSSEKPFETSLPYGRDKNVIFYGAGDTTEISFSATIVDKADCYGGELSRKQAWDTIRNNQGVYYFRTSKGEMYYVGLRSVGISNEDIQPYALSVDMVEVI